MIVKVKESTIVKINEKREFLIYLIGIKHNIKIHKMLSKYTQHRQDYCIYTFEKCCIS